MVKYKVDDIVIATTDKPFTKTCYKGDIGIIVSIRCIANSVMYFVDFGHPLMSYAYKSDIKLVKF